MPRNMSFSLTTQQILAGTKTVTRRLGWSFLKPGDIVNACEKCQGIKKGEKIRKLRTLRIVSVKREPLSAMNDDLDYGFSEVVKEGFEAMRFPSVFVEMFCSHMGCKPETAVNRIEFEYVE